MRTDTSANSYEVNTEGTIIEDDDLHFRDLESIDTCDYPIAVGDGAGGQDLPSQGADSQETTMPSWSQETRLFDGDSAGLEESQAEVSWQGTSEEAATSQEETEIPQTVVMYNSFTPKTVSEEDFVWDLS